MSKNTQELIILVHPASLCGSYGTIHDWHGGWKSYARMQRQYICNSFSQKTAKRIVVLGTELDDEIQDYPCVKTAVEAAEETYYATPDGQALEQAAADIAKKHKKAKKILVTGAWCDKPHGCAWTLYAKLKKIMGEKAEVTLDPEGARESDINELETDD